MSKERRRKRRPGPLPGRAGGTRSAGPAPQAPDPATTIVVGGRSRTEARRAARTRRRRRRSALLGAVAVLALIAVVATVTVVARSHKKGPADASGRTQRTLLVQLAETNGSVVEAVLLAHDPRDSTGALVLIPSRVIAEVPGRGSAAFGQALALGGPQVAQDALADLVGVTVDGSLVLDRAGLAVVIDRLGGVDVDVDVEVLGPATAAGRPVIVPVGRQKLSGAAAVAYATYLAPGETELARLPRLQAVLDALLVKVEAAGRAGVVTALKAAGPGARYVGVKAEGVADLLVGLAGAKDVTEDSLPVRDIDTGGPIAYGIDPTGLAALVSSALAASVPTSGQNGAERVLVQNGVGTPGVGASVRSRLTKAGFRYRAGGNVPGFPFRSQSSVVLIPDASDASIDLGQRVAKALGLSVADVKVSTEGQSVAEVIVIIGRDYRA